MLDLAFLPSREWFPLNRNQPSGIDPRLPCNLRGRKIIIEVLFMQSSMNPQGEPAYIILFRSLIRAIV